jgi:hypothetical protein
MTPDIADIIAGELKVSRGTAYDMMREALKEASPVEPVAKVHRHGESSNGTPWHGIKWLDEGVNMPDGTLLYATPQPVPVKTYHDGKPWPVQPAPDPAPIIQQLVTALEGSGTKMRSDQWYIEIEAVAAGKFYLNSKGANHD